MSNVLKMKSLTRAKFWLHYATNHYRFKGAEGYYGPEKSEKKRRKIEDIILSESESYGAGLEQEVPTYHKGELSAAEFKQKFLKPNRPVVLKGYGKEMAACKKWDLDFFKTYFGEEMVPCREHAKSISDESLFVKDVSVAELVDDIKGGGQLFGSNLADVLNRNESLREDLSLEKLEAYMCMKKKDKIMSTQLFMSGGGTKTLFHASGGVNMFLQVHGHKKWTFVDPKYTPWMYPVLRKDFLYTGSKIPWTASKETISEEGFPLYNYVPKQIACLEPGDVLFSPQWWWHAVETQTDSIGVACRTINKLVCGSVPYSLMWVTSKEFRALAAEALKEGRLSDMNGGALTIFDRK